MQKTSYCQQNHIPCMWIKMRSMFVYILHSHCPSLSAKLLKLLSKRASIVQQMKIVPGLAKWEIIGSAWWKKRASFSQHFPFSVTKQLGDFIYLRYSYPTFLAKDINFFPSVSLPCLDLNSLHRHFQTPFKNWDPDMVIESMMSYASGWVQITEQATIDCELGMCVLHSALISQVVSRAEGLKQPPQHSKLIF